MQTHESKTSILAISAEPALRLITLRTKARTRQNALQRRNRTWARHNQWDSDTLIACFQPIAVALIYPEEKWGRMTCRNCASSQSTRSPSDERCTPRDLYTAIMQPKRKAPIREVRVRSQWLPVRQSGSSVLYVHLHYR